MPRTTQKTKSIKQKIDEFYIFCQYCKANRDRRGYKKHQISCKVIWQARHRVHSVNETAGSRSLHRKDEPRSDISVIPASAADVATASESTPSEGENSLVQCVPPQSTRPGSENTEAILYGPNLPEIYLKIIPHPHSVKRDAQIIPLTGQSTFSAFKPYVPESVYKPWAPFRTLADFEYTETAIQGLLSKDLVNKQLAGFHNRWFTGESRLTIKNYDDMQESLSKARAYVVQFKYDEVAAMYKGKSHKFQFQYRDPWEYILNLIQDKSLTSVSSWNSVRKVLCRDGGSFEDRIFDEPNTAETWWEVDSSLPDNDVYPHSYLPLHFWLDKGLVTRRVKKYPMVLRAAWLPRSIRNASGNGGGMLLGYMPIIEDPKDPSERNASETVEFAKFKREVYQLILSRIFGPLGRRSRIGEAHICNDNVTRILHPGMLIESQDGEESAYFCACRAATANFPCPKCLVSKSELHNITKYFEQRTTNSMRSVFERAARTTSKTAKEQILQAYGLHDVKHFLWDFRFSDPYAACSYDTLHSDDLGKWGKHLWALLEKILEDSKCLGKLTTKMREFPPWTNLKHFNHVSTIPFTDGQSYYDILKCILPCIVQLLPKNSPLIHCIRSYQRYRIIIGLRCMTESRLEHLKEEIKVYKRWCSKVSDTYGKNFDFFKQHYVSHIIPDIRQKGTTDNTSTRPGEGFQQESAQAYKQTNKKKAELQMVRIDENQEAIAQIRMAIDDNTKSQALTGIAEGQDPIPDASLHTESGLHWRLGSRDGARLNTAELEQKFSSNHDFHDFDGRLRSFISHSFPSDIPRHEDVIFVEVYKCLYLTYQSMEDWSEARDILRCNANFHQRERYDCAIINTEGPETSIARLRALLRCRLPSGKWVDMALIHSFRSQSHWKPNTKWHGCQVLAEEKESSFLLIKYLVRGALMCPAFESDNRSFYTMDTVDGDMFIRLNKWI